MSVARAAAVAATPEPAATLDIGGAFTLASAIIKENRDPSEEETRMIDAAIAAAAGPMKEALGQAFHAWRQYLTNRALVAADVARRRIEAEQRRELQARWAGRPARWRALRGEAQLAFHLAASFGDGDELLAARDVTRACQRIATELIDQDSATIPWSFERDLGREVELAGIARRNAVQKVNEGL